MANCSCGARPEPGEDWCGACGRRLVAGRQPETITVTQVLLVLSAVIATVGLLLTAAAASAVGSMVAGVYQLGGAPVPAEVVQSIGQVLVSAGVAALVVVAVDAWAFVALGRGRASARWALTALAVVEAAATTAAMISAGAPALAILIVVLIGLLVFDVPILVLLWGPESSRQWLGRAAAPGAAGEPAPAGPVLVEAVPPAPVGPVLVGPALVGPTPVSPALAGPAPARPAPAADAEVISPASSTSSATGATADASPRPRLVALSTTGAIRVPEQRSTVGPVAGSGDDVDPVGAESADAASPGAARDEIDADDPATDRLALRLLTPVRSGRHSSPES